MTDRIVSTAEKKFITLSSEIIYFIPNIWLGLSFSIGGNSVLSPTAPAHVAFNKVWRCFPGLSQLRRVLLPSNEWETGILNIYGIEDSSQHKEWCSLSLWFTILSFYCRCRCLCLHVFSFNLFSSLHLFDLEILCYVNLVPCRGVASQQKQ